MCTVSWLRCDDGYHLLCNRDEKRSRPPAQPPVVEVAGNLQVLAPIDGVAPGGTWISTNNYGVSVCLINGTLSGREKSTSYEGNPYPISSRGLVVRQLASSRCLEEACDQLDTHELSSTLPFTLVALQPGHPSTVVEWDGSTKSVFPDGDTFRPLISSSFDALRVRERRWDEFSRTVGRDQSPEIRNLCKFHRSHSPEKGALSPCMHRDDAETVSFSWVRVKADRVSFRYFPGPPCLCSQGHVRGVSRR